MEPSAFTDAELLRAHVVGDAQAFAALYDRHGRASFQFIRRLLGGAHAPAAEDLHQDTWVSIAQSADRYEEGKASFPAWLFTIARRKVWDYFRKQKVAVLSALPDDDPEASPDPDPTPLERLVSRQLAERLVSAVEALPLLQRETFIMFAVSGLTLEETAEITGVGLETAKSRLRYARATLRNTLANERVAHV